MTDGSVMLNRGDPGWFRLTPDAKGNYANGTWTPTAPMSQSRLFFASQILPSGKLFVLGGEYGTVGNNGTVEIYDPVSNAWSPGTSYSTNPNCDNFGLPDPCFGAVESMLMPGGKQILAGSLVDNTAQL